jgi:hypothetical protein
MRLFALVWTIFIFVSLYEFLIGGNWLLVHFWLGISIVTSAIVLQAKEKSE